jgi:hypothetical protein
MTKPTGRPRGRPKTKEYRTLMARVPLEIAAEVQRYAAAHRQPLSVVIRDALALLMEEFPARRDHAAPQRLAAHEFLSDRYETPLDTLLGETDGAELDEFLSDTKGAIVEEILSDTDTDTPAIMSDKKVVPDKLSDTQEDTAPRAGAEEPGRVSCPPFDTSSHRLGRLCPRNHEWGTTGQSLRANNRAGYCLACNAELSRAKRHAAKAAVAS